VRILLDTHCWLWWHLEPERMSRGALELVADPYHQIAFSVASSWEIVVKYALGKLRLPEPPESYIPSRLEAQGLRILPIEQVHALGVASLPSLHADPFDRVLIAQAQVEKLKLLTADPRILAYDVETIWAGVGEPPPRRAHRIRVSRSRAR
jgi:PIN domain nuclease of toxin-antitoxin system